MEMDLYSNFNNPVLVKSVKNTNKHRCKLIMFLTLSNNSKNLKNVKFVENKSMQILLHILNIAFNQYADLA